MAAKKRGRRKRLMHLRVCKSDGSAALTLDAVHEEAALRAWAALTAFREKDEPSTAAVWELVSLEERGAMTTPGWVGHVALPPREPGGQVIEYAGVQIEEVARA